MLCCASHTIERKQKARQAMGGLNATHWPARDINEITRVPHDITKG